MKSGETNYAPSGGDATGRGDATGGAIHLVATPIGNLGDLSPRARQTLSEADIIACEDTRRTGRLLELAGIQTLRPPRLVCLNEHSENQVADELIQAARQGQQIAVVTDAGTPGISDPPTKLVSLAQAHNVSVRAVPGPSAVLTALSLSGLEATRFVFEGFLPRSGKSRSSRLAELTKQPRTIVLFESPHRLTGTLADLANALGADRPAALAQEMTKLHEQVISDSLGNLVRESDQITVRGEFVIVIQGAPPPAEATDAELLVALKAEISGGATLRDAARSVAKDTGTSKRRAYALGLTLAKQH